MALTAYSIWAQGCLDFFVVVGDMCSNDCHSIIISHSIRLSLTCSNHYFSELATIWVELRYMGRPN